MCSQTTAVSINLQGSAIYTLELHLMDTPKKRPSTTLHTLRLVPNAFSYICVQSKTPHSIKQTGAPVSTVPELYKIHSIILTLMYLFRTIVH